MKNILYTNKYVTLGAHWTERNGRLFRGKINGTTFRITVDSLKGDDDVAEITEKLNDGNIHLHNIDTLLKCGKTGQALYNLCQTKPLSDYINNKIHVAEQEQVLETLLEKGYDLSNIEIRKGIYGMTKRPYLSIRYEYKEIAHIDDRAKIYYYI